MNSNPLKIHAEIAAPLQKAWELWNDENAIKIWNHASEDWHCPSAINDFHEGGTFCYTMAAKDGSFSFDFAGTYLVIHHLKKIHYRLEDGRNVYVIFEEKEGKTYIEEIFDPENMNPHEMQRQGWQAILDNFKRLAEHK